MLSGFLVMYVRYIYYCRLPIYVKCDTVVSLLGLSVFIEPSIILKWIIYCCGLSLYRKCQTVVSLFALYLFI